MLKSYSEVLKVAAVLGASDETGVLGRILMLLNSNESCLGVWLLCLRANGNSLEELVPM